MDEAYCIAPPWTFLQEGDHYPNEYANRKPLLTSTPGAHPPRSMVRPGITQTDDAQPQSGRSSGNDVLLLLGHIPSCSEVPDKCFFLTMGWKTLKSEFVLLCSFARVVVCGYPTPFF